MMSAKRPRFSFMIHFGQLVTIDRSCVILFAKGVQDGYTYDMYTCIGM